MPAAPLTPPFDTNTWRCGRFVFDLGRPLIMGIVNVTPDSFSDGGRFFDPTLAVAHARQLIEDGADMLDIGGESTRPGAAEVSVDEEMQRVLPIVEALRDVSVALSIDSSKPEVMRAALERGAAIINDVRSLSMPGALEVVLSTQCGVVLMHMQGSPQTMQIDPRYADVTVDVGAFLRDRCGQIESAGVARDRIALDPGFGFGKTNAHNFELLARLHELTSIGRPLLVGISRKGMLKHATGRSVGDRTTASAAAALIAVERGARIVRVHDVAATRDALAVWQTTRDYLKGQV